MYKGRTLYKYTVHNYRQTIEVDSIRVDTAGTSAQWAPTAGQLAQFGSLSAIYDQYRIKKVIIRIEPAFTSNELFASLGSNVNTTGKYIRVVHDYDDDNALPNEAAAFEYSNMKSYPSVSTKPIKITLYPKLRGVVNDQGINNFSPYLLKPQWIDCGNPGVEHLGVKAWFPGIAPVGTNAQVWRIFFTYLIQFKNVR